MSSVSWTVSGLRFMGHGCHGWSLVLWRKSSRFLPDLNYSCVKWDGEIDLPPINILFGNGEVICRELVAVVKWYPGISQLPWRAATSEATCTFQSWFLCMAYMQNYGLFHMTCPTWVSLSRNPGLHDRQKEVLDSKGNFVNDDDVGDEVYH